MANAKIIAQKQTEVDELAKKMKEAKIVLLTDYRGITVSDVTLLRKNLRGVNTEYSVIKNNITKRALEANNYSGLEDKLEGPTAVILGNEDYLSTAKVVYEYAKENKFYQIKGGVIEGKVVTAEEIITLAQLPSREVLIAKLAGSLLGTITKLAATLEAVRVQKEAQA